VADFSRTLRRLAIRDDRYIGSVLADDFENAEASHLDPKTHALVRLGALIALDAPPTAYQASADAALAAGATFDEIVGTLIAVLPAAGVARVTSAAPKLGLGLGYDVESEVESGGEESDEHWNPGL
jgi:alkylhydroperoxidase/carboxymuconolactone decarboxylase family protein YurZ